MGLAINVIIKIQLGCLENEDGRKTPLFLILSSSRPTKHQLTV